MYFLIYRTCSTWSTGVLCQFCFDYSVTLCCFLTQPLCRVCLSEQWPWAVPGRLWVPRAGSWVGVSAQNIWLPQCRSFTRTVLTTVPHLCRWEISVFTGKYPCMRLGLQCFNGFFYHTRPDMYFLIRNIVADVRNVIFSVRMSILAVWKSKWSFSRSLQTPTDLIFPFSSHANHIPVGMRYMYYTGYSLLVEANTAVYGTGLQKANTSDPTVKGTIFTVQHSTKLYGLFFRKLSREH